MSALVDSPIALWAGLGSAFGAVALLLWALLWRPENAPMRVLQRGLRLYTHGGRTKEQPETGMAATALGRRATELVERVPRSQGYLERLQGVIDRAGWPMRATELVVIQAMGMAGGLLVGAGLLRSWWLAPVLGVLGGIAPRMALAQRVAKRSAAFVAQLPDTLQLLAASLQAGYGFMQAIDTVAKEAPQPTSGEFARVLSEARLGLPVDDALQAMAERMGGDDFRWVVMAITIQRQVGGNLAELLTIVAGTLREREQVRRQVKVLSAEGRLSAIVLIALPFVLTGYIAMANRSYLAPLLSERIGHVMVGGAVVLMAAGIVWLRRIIRIDV